MAKRPKRHILLCSDTRREGCSGAKRMRRAWKRLEQAVEDAKLEDEVLCTRTRCLGICDKGPIAVVYPDAVWYGGFEGEAIDRIVEGHLGDGKVVEELAFRGPSAPRRRTP
jgi:(2Fe-2S) ferredoxin